MQKLNHWKDFIQSIHDLYYPAIAKQIRKDLKTVFEKNFKFSVKTETYSWGWSINIEILEWNIQFYTDKYIELKRILSKSWSYEDRENLRREYPIYTKEGEMIIEEVERIHKQYNHNNSDSMLDYYDVNYYWQVEIWRRNKEYIKI